MGEVEKPSQVPLLPDESLNHCMSEDSIYCSYRALPLTLPPDLKQILEDFSFWMVFSNVVLEPGRKRDLLICLFLLHQGIQNCFSSKMAIWQRE